MQDIVDVTGGAFASCRIANITLDRREAPPLSRAQTGADFLKVGCPAGRVIVERDNFLAELKQGFHQVGSDKAGSAGDEP